MNQYYYDMCSEEVVKVKTEKLLYDYDTYSCVVLRNDTILEKHWTGKVFKRREYSNAKEARAVYKDEAILAYEGSRFCHIGSSKAMAIYWIKGHANEILNSTLLINKVRQA